MALAPREVLLGVPSSASSRASMAAWFVASSPSTSSAMVSVTLDTAERTPRPRYRFASWSRSSWASCSPVDAPEGTMARPKPPLSRATSTSTVGFPRESRTSRAATLDIKVTKGLRIKGSKTGMDPKYTSESSLVAVSRCWMCKRRAW